MLELDDKNFKDDVLKSEKPVVVDFFAFWCGPCKAMSPIFEELSKELKNVKFAKLNVDNYGRLASNYNIMSIPTFIIFKNGKEVSRLIGGMPKETFKEKIKQAINI